MCYNKGFTLLPPTSLPRPASLGRRGWKVYYARLRDLVLHLYKNAVVANAASRAEEYMLQQRQQYFQEMLVQQQQQHLAALQQQQQQMLKQQQQLLHRSITEAPGGAGGEEVPEEEAGNSSADDATVSLDDPETGQAKTKAGEDSVVSPSNAADK